MDLLRRTLRVAELLHLRIYPWDRDRGPEHGDGWKRDHDTGHHGDVKTDKARRGKHEREFRKGWPSGPWPDCPSTPGRWVHGKFGCDRGTPRHGSSEPRCPPRDDHDRGAL